MSNSQTDELQGLTVTVANTLAGISAHEWDSCANPSATEFNPFLSHAFLAALEKSGCLGVEKGWIPQHLILRDGETNVLGVMPCYVKTHSRGEYVFDDAWAHAFESAGGSYYPKLQCAVPFTPVPGRRILVKSGPDANHHERILVFAAIELASKLELSSLHITFIEKQQNQRLTEIGMLGRTDQQFHWNNDSYGSFEDFLNALSSRKRKSIRKERQSVLDAGVEIEHITGTELTDEHWEYFFEFYLDTGQRKWGSPYLNLEFFKLLGASMGDACLLVMARRNGEYIAGALNIIGSECLYGRYWGTKTHIPYLHFEVCYYQAIEYAIENGLSRVEAGAQGEHKLARGYVPTTTYSSHWIADKSLRDAINRYLNRERSHVAHMHDMLQEFTPFKKSQTQNQTD